MDARKAVEEDIKNCIRKATKLGILANPRMSGDFFKDRKSISSKYTRFADKNDYLENYFRKYEKGEFLATLDDGAFFQIHYEFDIQSKRNTYLSKMNLCYLPPVSQSGELQNEYIRIDFSNTADNSFFHAYAHVHIGFGGEIRIPLNETLYFSEFLELILYLFYPDQFKSFCKDMRKMGNTRDKSQTGKLTKDKVLTKELEQFFYLKTVSI